MTTSAIIMHYCTVKKLTMVQDIGLNSDWYVTRGIRDRVDCRVAPAFVEPSPFSLVPFAWSLLLEFRRVGFRFGAGSPSASAAKGVLSSAFPERFGLRAWRFPQDWDETLPWPGMSSARNNRLSTLTLNSEGSVSRGVGGPVVVPGGRGLLLFLDDTRGVPFATRQSFLASGNDFFPFSFGYTCEAELEIAGCARLGLAWKFTSTAALFPDSSAATDEVVSSMITEALV
jgi:hypothetical protein